MTWHGWLSLSVELLLAIGGLSVAAYGGNKIADFFIGRRRRRVIAEEVARMDQERVQKRRQVLDAAARIH